MTFPGAALGYCSRLKTNVHMPTTVHSHAVAALGVMPGTRYAFLHSALVSLHSAKVDE